MSQSADAADRPSWAARIRAERMARKWTQAEAVRALEAHSTTRLPERESLLRNWKRWEAGERKPDDFYQQLVAKTFGTVSGAIFPVETKARPSTPHAPDVDTLNLVERLRVSDVSSATLDGLRINAERLACAYPHASSEQLHADGQAWFTRTTALLDKRLTLSQHRDILNHAGWTALVLGCVEYDMGRHSASEATRQAALSLGKEAGNAEVMAWAYEMRAWFALTQGDYRAAIAAADSGQARNGDLEHAVDLGEQALGGERKSLPSLQMVASELGSELTERYPGEARAAAYVERLRSLTAA